MWMGSGGVWGVRCPLDCHTRGALPLGLPAKHGDLRGPLPACLPACLPTLDTYQKNDVLSIQHSIVNHVEYTMARSRYAFDDFEAYEATALSLRDRLIEGWNDTQTYFKCVRVGGEGAGAEAGVGITETSACPPPGCPKRQYKPK